MQKIKNIEFLRVVLLLGIIMHHMFMSTSFAFNKLFSDVSLFNFLSKAFDSGMNGVEAFFIISGFLFVLTFKESQSFIDFIKNKYLRLSPVICVSVSLSFIGTLLGVLKFNVVPDLLSIFLLNNFVISFGNCSNRALWFTSALFSGLILYWFIIKGVKRSDLKYKIVLSLVLFAYTLLIIFSHGRFVKPYINYFYIFNIGFLRALGGIGIGCLVGMFYKEYFNKLKENFYISLNSFSYIGITVLEVLFLGLTFWWLMMPHARMNNIIFVVIFTILFILFILRKGAISNLFEKDIFVYLGKFQYSIYVIHFLIVKILNLFFWKYHANFVVSNIGLVIGCNLITVFICGVLTYYFVEVPCAKFLKKRWFNQ